MRAPKKDNHTLGRGYLKKIPDNAEAVAGVISKRGSRGTPSPFLKAYSLGAKCQFPPGRIRFRSQPSELFQSEIALTLKVLGGGGVGEETLLQKGPSPTKPLNRHSEGSTD